MVTMSGESSKLFLLVFLVAIFYLLLQQKSTTANNVIMCKESERQALLDFKQSLELVDQPGNGNLSSWNGKDCCAWGGVHCNSHTGYVEELNLGSSALLVAGTLSPSLLKLQHLRSLDLSDNNFNGSCIPELVGSLKNLRHLHLSCANFGGPIPCQLGNLSKLETLYLGGYLYVPDTLNNKHLSLGPNFLSVGNLDWLSHLSSLKELDLSFNNLSEASDWSQAINQLPSLEKLSMNDCDLPSSFSSPFSLFNSSPSLTHLYLSGNNLNGTISEGIGLLSNLEVLQLAGNSFENVTISEAHFSNLSNLRELDLSDTSVTLKFNSDWVPPFNLRLIYLRSCKLGPQFPQWVRTQTSCSEIDISAAEISDSIPSWFWNISSFSYMTSVNLSFNQISGTLPNNSIAIFFLDLSSNNLTGPLPQITRFSVTLNLSKNKLYGSLTSICTIPGNEVYALILLDLSNNLFSGEIPNCFAKWREGMRALNLAGNSFSGSIPSSFGSLTVLEMLNLRSNSFSGPLPSSLRNCSWLRFLDLSDNRLSGNIPEWIGQSFSSLIFLGLHNNLFNGTITHQFCGLNNIQILDLSANKISGNLPRCLNNFVSMARVVNLSTTIEHSISRKWDPNQNVIDVNYVDEAVFTWMGQKQKYAKILGLLLAIDLSSNRLTGDIPKELTSLHRLVALNLSRNLLSGQIPWTIGQLRQLQVLDLSRNNISGSIPSSLSELTFLSSLDFSYNFLSGKIPTGRQIQLFDPSSFSHNHGLCGPPLTPNCSSSTKTHKAQAEDDNDDDEFKKWFYTGMGLGFVVSFWGLCGALLFKRNWRHSYFRFLDNKNDSLYVRFVLLKARLERRIQT